MPWFFLDKGVPVEFAPRSDVKVSDEPLGCVVLARHGLGLVHTFEWIAQSYDGKLVEVLQANAGRTRPFYLLYPQNRHLSTRVRALVDFLTTK